MKEATFTFEDISVGYRLRSAGKDRKHLVVVFAGVSKEKHDFYGFDGEALNHVQGAVLWIKDSFEESNAYYMCSGMDFRIELAVAELIDTVLQSLELSSDQCTLLGGSKGGSAALLFGLKYSYRNIIASVPQTLVGTYTRQKLPDTFSFMAGDDHELAEETLNSYLPAAIRSPQSWSKNVYIVSSRQDPEYGVHIEPLLPDLLRFENFNLLLTDSMLVTSHPEVTPYNIPYILSVLYSLCENIAPRFGLVSNGNGSNDRVCGQSDEPTAPLELSSRLHWAQIKEDKFLFAGYAAAFGKEVSSPPSISPFLILRSQGEEMSIELRASVDASVNSNLYRRQFVDYRWAGILPAESTGISLGGLPEGRHALLVSPANLTGVSEIALTGSKKVKACSTYGGYNYDLAITPLGTIITKSKLDNYMAPDAYFRFTSLKLMGSMLDISGTFIIPREWMRSWDEGKYVCTMDSANETITFPLATTRLEVPSLEGVVRSEDYMWSHFSTPGHKGIRLTELTLRDYSCYVSFIRAGRVYTSPSRFRISFDDAAEPRIDARPH